MKLTPEERRGLARTKGFTIAIWIVLFVALVIAGIAADCDGQEMSSEYIYAVVTRGPGVAGTRWRTSLCLTNPQWYELHINARLWQHGGMMGAGVYVGGNKTRCWEDFLLEWFNTKRYQGTLILRSLSEENPLLTYVEFTPNVRIYNQTDEGTFGVHVAPFSVYPGEDPRGPAYPWGQMSGVIQRGTPGEDGFRASVGVFNADVEPRDVDVWLRERNGNVAWQERLNIPGRSQRQVPVPEWVQMTDPGSVTMQDPLWNQEGGASPIYGYSTVVDNQTGDGVYIPAARAFEWQIEED